MNMDIKKNGKLTLKDTPYFEPIDNTNISFTNMDIGTARITFRIMKHGLPLQVSEKNVYVYAYLESSNGSRAEVIELNFDDPINGLVSLQLDKEFLLAATNTTVKGQLYISMHKWNTVSDDFSDTVALQEFTFTVKDALVNQISGVTKIQYIRTFDQLKTEVKERMKEMEEDIGEIATLKQEITDLFTKSKNDIDKLSKDTIKELNDTSANNLDEIDGKLKSAKSNIDNSILNYKESVENIRDGFQKFIDENEFITTKDFDNYKIEIKELTESFSSNIQAIKEELRDDTSQQIDNKINDLNWQKHAFTKEDGTLYEYDFQDKEDDFLSLENGIYYVTKVPIDKDQTSQNGFVFVKSRDEGEPAKHIVFSPYNSTQLYLKRYYKEWKDWELMNNEVSNTGWKDMTLENGAKAYSDDKKPQYKITTIGGSKMISIRGAVTNITKNDVTVGSIPLSLSYPEYFSQTTSTKEDKDGRSYPPHNKWVVTTNGKLRLELFDFEEKDIIGNEFNIINHTFQV